MPRILQRDLRLPQHLVREILAVVYDDATSIDHFEAAAGMFGGSMDAVARDTRFVADNGAPLAGNSVK